MSGTDEVGVGVGSISVVGKVRVILETLGRSDGVVGLSELARRTGLAKATVHRISAELVEWGVVERAGDAYRLGVRLFELGGRVPATRVLRDLALPFLEDLAAATGETVHLAVVDGTEVVYLERLPGSGSEAIPSSVAARLPLHCTATGRCILAFGQPELLVEATETELERLTPATITDPARLSAVLADVRERGVAVERGEVVDGVMSVGAPIFEVGRRLIGAVSATGDESGFDEAAVAALVRLGAAGLSHRLGFAAPTGPAAGRPVVTPAAGE